MNGIIHTTQLLTDKWEAIKKNELKEISLNGYYTFPLYAENEETVILKDEAGVRQGEIAITSINIKASAKDIVTSIEIVPVLDIPSSQICSCGGNCQCNNTPV